MAAPEGFSDKDIYALGSRSSRTRNCRRYA
jgi:hypothetical protein